MDSAIYVAEYRSLACGVGVLDEMLKASGAQLLHAAPICIGKYLICLGGDVAEVAVAQNLAEHTLSKEDRPAASYLLSRAHPDILHYFQKGSFSANIARPHALCVFETAGAAAGFLSLDAALKSAQVHVAKIWLGQLLGGKFCFVLCGETSETKSALRAAERSISEKECLGKRLILTPDAATLNLFMKGGTAHGVAGAGF